MEVDVTLIENYAQKNRNQYRLRFFLAYFPTSVIWPYK